MFHVGDRVSALDERFRHLNDVVVAYIKCGAERTGTGQDILVYSKTADKKNFGHSGQGRVNGNGCWWYRETSLTRKSTINIEVRL